MSEINTPKETYEEAQRIVSIALDTKKPISQIQKEVQDEVMLLYLRGVEDGIGIEQSRQQQVNTQVHEL